jgi:hypothetical protein
MHRQIKLGMNLELIEQIAINKNDLINNKLNFIRLDEREFRLNGKLYDIVRTWEIADTIFFKCINDKREEELEHQFFSFVVNNINSEELPLPIRNIIKIFQLDAVIAPPRGDDLKCSFDKKLMRLCPFPIVPEPTLEIPSPPPKISSNHS